MQLDHIDNSAAAFTDLLKQFVGGQSDRQPFPRAPQVLWRLPASTVLSGEKTARSRLFEPPITLLAFDSRER